MHYFRTLRNVTFFSFEKDRTEMNKYLFDGVPISSLFIMCAYSYVISLCDLWYWYMLKTQACTCATFFGLPNDTIFLLVGHHLFWTFSSFQQHSINSCHFHVDGSQLFQVPRHFYSLSRNSFFSNETIHIDLNRLTQLLLNTNLKFLLHVYHNDPSPKHPTCTCNTLILLAVFLLR